MKQLSNKDRANVMFLISNLNYTAESFCKKLEKTLGIQPFVEMRTIVKHPIDSNLNLSRQDDNNSDNKTLNSEYLLLSNIAKNTECDKEDSNLKTKILSENNEPFRTIENRSSIIYPNVQNLRDINVHQKGQLLSPTLPRTTTTRSSTPTTSTTTTSTTTTTTTTSLSSSSSSSLSPSKVNDNLNQNNNGQICPEESMNTLSLMSSLNVNDKTNKDSENKDNESTISL